MKKTIASLTVAGALFGGGAAALAVPAVAGAQEAEEEAQVSNRLRDVLDQLVADGVIDQAQSDTVEEALREAAPFGRRGERRAAHLETTATALGVSSDELREALTGGQSIADVAKANGVSVDTVVDALMADAEERLAEIAEERGLSEAEIAERQAQLEARITARVNGERPERPGHFHGPGPGGEVEPEDASFETA